MKFKKIDYEKVAEEYRVRFKTNKYSAYMLRQIHICNRMSKVVKYNIDSILDSKKDYTTIDLSEVSKQLLKDIGKMYEPFYLRCIYDGKYKSKLVYDLMKKYEKQG